jgi:enamine deaminase RidA (YjgF/YER057c/UK114 family)
MRIHSLPTLLPLFLSLFPAGSAAAPAEVVFTGDAKSAIASGVGVPAGRAYYWTSGTVPGLINRNGATVYERFGDTYAQGVSCLKRIADVLAKEGLTLKDVVYLRVYVTPDAAKGGKPDFAGWFKAYGEFFNTKENPVKTARSTVGVAALVNPDWLIEIEAVAVYPLKK